MSKKLLILLFFSMLCLAPQMVLAEQDPVIPFCEKKKLKNGNYILCEEILAGYDLRANNKGYDIKTIQYVVRHVYDLYNAYWHEKDVIDENRLEISLLFLDKFGRDFILDNTDVGTKYYRQMSFLTMYTNENTFDVYKEYLMKPDTTIDNISYVLQFNRMDKYKILDKSDFEILIYLINDRTLPDKYVSIQPANKIYEMLLLSLNRDKLDNDQKKYSKMYFDNILYNKLKNGVVLSKDNIDTFEFLTRVQYLDESKKDFLTIILNKNYDISLDRLKKIMYCIQDEKISDDAINYIIRTDEITDYISKISDLNLFAKERKEYDKNYLLTNKQVRSIMNHSLDKAEKLKILTETFENPYAQNKYDIAYGKITRTYQKQVDKKIIKECFVSFDAHVQNMIANNSNNMAVFVGLLNPINLVGTIVASPIILFLKALP